MRICLITPELPPFVCGGIGAYVETLARGYFERGHEVTVAGFRIHPEPHMSNNWGESVSLDSRLPIEWFRNDCPAIWRLRRFYTAARIAKAAVSVRDYLKSRRSVFDIVEAANWPGHGAFVPHGRFKFVVRVSTPGIDSGMSPSAYTTWFEGRSCLRADRVIAHTMAICRKAVSYYGINEASVSVIPLGVPDTGAPSEHPTLENLSLVYVGRAENRKGTDLLIRALSKVMGKHPKLHLAVIGGDFGLYSESDPELKEIWHSILARFGTRINLLGQISEAEKLAVIARSHWIVIPSRFESFGLVAVESMRAGTPILGARIASLEEICSAGSPSVLFRSEDVHDLAASLEKICVLGPEFALGLRDQTRRTYLGHFQADLMVDRSLALYESLLKSCSEN